MKKLLVLLITAACITVLSISVNAEPWNFFGSIRQISDTVSLTDVPKSASPSASSGNLLEAFSGSSLTAFVPINLDQLTLSLVDTKGDNKPLSPRFRINTGIKTETYLTDSKSLSLSEMLGNDKTSFDVTSSVIFVGVGLDFKSGFLKGNAFAGRPLDILGNRLFIKDSERTGKQGVDTNALGFGASAGYQLSDKVALGAGFGRINDKNDVTDKTEEIYAIYAQAVLAVAPGIQVKPEVGQVEHKKDEKVSETKDDSFYAGAIWEINF